jgi:hypothetical protein
MIVSVEALQNKKYNIRLRILFAEFSIFNVPHHASMSRRSGIVLSDDDFEC